MNDLLLAVNREFKSIVDCTLDSFETSGNKENHFRFAGIHITYIRDQIYAIDQFSYKDILTRLRTDTSFKEFYSVIMQLA